jgi:hypothetical protein
VLVDEELFTPEGFFLWATNIITIQVGLIPSMAVGLAKPSSVIVEPGKTYHTLNPKILRAQLSSWGMASERG